MENVIFSFMRIRQIYVGQIKILNIFVTAYILIFIKFRKFGKKLLLKQ